MKFKSAFLPLVLFLFTALASGCASITGTTKQSISVQTVGQEGKEVRDAACELANNKGKWFVTSPGSVTVTPSNDDMQVICKKQGGEPGRASVVSATKGAMFGNIVLGGGIGAIIDYSSGAAFAYPTFVQVVMGAFKTIEMSKTVGKQPGGGNLNVPSAAIQHAMASQASVTAPESVSSTSQEDNNSSAANESERLRVYVIPNPLYQR